MMERAWKSYYNYFDGNRGYSFSSHLLEYQKAVDHFFPQNTNLRVLIGGIAGDRSSNSFYRSWGLIRPGNQDKVVFLDQNLAPLAEIGKARQKVQARLEELPFKSASFDLILLDFTLDFLNNQQLVKFFAKAKETLTPEGKIIALVDSPLFCSFENLLGRITFGVPYFSRRSKRYSRFASCFFEFCDFQEIYKEGLEKDVCLLVFGNQAGQQEA